MVTHSDTLLRDSVGAEGFRVFHMTAPHRSDGRNQLAEVEGSADVERLVIELVGDLAAYRPGATIVIFEGGGDTDFDVRMVSQLFPEFAAVTNPISGGGKRRVRDLHELLVQAGASLGASFYSIVDGDWGDPSDAPLNALSWDAYHIENYLLDPKTILSVLAELSGSDPSVRDEMAIRSALVDAARATLPRLVRQRLVARANAMLRQAVEVGANPQAEVAASLRASVEGAVERTQALGRGELSRDALGRFETEVTAELEQSLESDDWMRTFRGRDVLAEFTNRHLQGVTYEAFRDLIVARMRTAGHRPHGMAAVLTQIVPEGSIEAEPTT
jgi:hypothetical protein